MSAHRNPSSLLSVPLLAGVLASSLAFGDTIPGLGSPVRPRVMVILDSSRSMREVPLYSAGSYEETIRVEQSATGGDYDCGSVSAQPACENKFCTAKQVVCETLPTYTDGAVIGLASYNQYVVNKTIPNTLSTVCTYDVLEPANVTRYFTSTEDLNGSFTTFPGTPSPTSVNLAASGRPLNGVCLSGASSTYPVTKTSATVAGAAVLSSCGLFNSVAASAYTYPKTLTGTLPTGCVSTTNQYVAASATSYVTTGVKYRMATGSTCAATMNTGYTACAADTTTVTQTGCFSNGGSGGWGALTSALCPTAYKCDLTNTGSATIGAAAWYGFFDATATRDTFGLPLPTYTGNPPLASALPYSYSTGTALGATRSFTGTRTAQTTCAVGPFLATEGVGTIHRVADGSNLTTFGFTNIATTVQGNATNGLSVSVPASGPRNDTTPTRSGTSYTCAAGWPCDVTLATPTAAAFATTSTVYKPESSCTLASCTNSLAALGGCAWGTETTDGNTYYTVKSGACAAIAADIAVNPVPTAQAKITSGFTATTPSWPINCSSTINMKCNFNAPTTPTLTTTCSTVDKWDGTATYSAGCAANGNTYTGPVTTAVNGQVTYTYYDTPSSTASCPSPGSFASAPAAPWAIGSACTTYPCSVPAAGSTPTTLTVQQTTDVAPAGVGWTATGTSSNRGGVVFASSPAHNTFVNCSSYTTGTVDRGASFAGSNGAMTWLGSTATGANNCGSENNQACRACAFQPVQYEYSRKRYVCNYNASRNRFTPSTVQVCGYTRKAFPLRTCRASCNYTVTAKRFDFNQPTATECAYSATAIGLMRQPYSYTYSYPTKGGELYGTFRKSTAGVSHCSSTYGGATAAGIQFKADCPATLDNCTGAIPGSKCKLRRSLTQGTAPRYTNLTGAAYFGAQTANGAGNGTYFSSPELYSDTNRVECLAAEANPLTTSDTDATLAAGTANFCAGSGSAAVTSHALISDWYDPSVTSSLATIQTAMSPYTVTWSKGAATVAKSYGWSATGGSTSTQPSPAPFFVPVQNDAPSDGYDPTAQATAIKNALKRCVLPSVANGNISAGSTAWDTSTSGICMSQEADRQAPSWTAGMDFTPLYGALTNAGSYLADRLDSDPDYECRGYYLVLATDGLENTPASYSSADLATLVSGFRTLSAPIASRTKDLKTFVIGVGSGAAGSASLDAMASAGGTCANPATGECAYSATSLSQLQTVLGTIFSTITQGKYSRSRPVVASDGQNIYAAFFVKTPGTPEWIGELQAYKVNSDGSFSWRWNLSDKVNGQTGTARSLSAATGLAAANVDSFSTSAGTTLTNLIQSAVGYPTGLDPLTVINFVRNNSKAELFASSTVTRASRLGPIVNSAPTVVGKTPFDSSWGGTSSTARTEWGTYVEATRTRPRRVLVGTNDGFLRGVKEDGTGSSCDTDNVHDGLPLDGIDDDGHPDCNDGKEAWGFVPYHVVKNLYLQRNGGRRDTVNGLFTVNDICTATNAETCTSSQWLTAVVGSLRAGGQGLYALNVTDSSSAPTYLWGYEEADLGLTYSAPAIGRIRFGGNDKFVAIFGGGMNNDATNTNQGKPAYLLNAATGALLTSGSETSKYLTYKTTSSSLIAATGEVLAQPTTHRFPGNPYLFAAYLPVSDGSLRVMRFSTSQTDDSPSTTIAAWTPEEFWRPNGTRNNLNVAGGTAALTRVIQDVPDGGMPGWKLVNPSTTLQDENNSGSASDTAEDTFPMNDFQAKPIYNAPKIKAVLDPSGKLPDLFFGTGDALDPASPSSAFQSWNYVAALHDTNGRHGSTTNAARVMWAHLFVEESEQVVGEPALVPGGVIVATYTPPPSGTGCYQAGETTLYCFEPRTGALVDCLTYTSGAYSGQNTSVIKLGPVGIPSALIVIGESLYFATSSGGLTRQVVRPSPSSGDVRSFRRVR